MFLFIFMKKDYYCSKANSKGISKYYIAQVGAVLVSPALCISQIHGVNII